jgi:hypothetical protein
MLSEFADGCIHFGAGCLLVGSGMLDHVLGHVDQRTASSSSRHEKGVVVYS